MRGTENVLYIKNMHGHVLLLSNTIKIWKCCVQCNRCFQQCASLTILHFEEVAGEIIKKHLWPCIYRV